MSADNGHPDAAGGAGAGKAAANATATTAPPPPAASAQSGSAAPVAPAARPAATPIAWLALLLVLIVAGAGFYYVTDLQRRETALLTRVQGIEATTGQDTTTFDQLRDNLARQIELELEGIAARQARAEEDQQRAVSRLEAMVREVGAQTRREVADSVITTVIGDVTQRLAPLEEALREQQLLVEDLSIEDRQGWRLAEVQYLLRLANARLVMARDTASAMLLLRRADAILSELAGERLSGLREALAVDLAALDAAPAIDVEGLYLRLEALTGQVDALALYEAPGLAPAIDVTPPDNWRGRLARGFDAALRKLSDYVVVSQREVPVETLMDPQYEALVRHNLRMLLEQAQVAMLARQELPYRRSLERAEAWVTQYFGTGGPAAHAMAGELRELHDEPVSVALPTLENSLGALEAVMQARLAAAGG